MHYFVTINKDWELLIVVTKSFTLDVYGFIDPFFAIAL